jgi:hypothetical protein
MARTRAPRLDLSAALIPILFVVLAAPTVVWLIRRQRAAERLKDKTRPTTTGPKHRWWQP